MAGRSARADAGKANLMRAIGAALLALIATGAAAETITAAHYIAPTGRYAHGILGDALEWGGLQVSLANGGARRFHLPRDHVFEDIAPRLVDVTGDGAPEVLETDDARRCDHAPRKITETRYRPARWLAPGAADLMAMARLRSPMSKPHLARVLWSGACRWASQRSRANDGADQSSHRRAARLGGLRDCGAGPEMVLADADWERVVGCA